MLECEHDTPFGTGYQFYSRVFKLSEDNEQNYTDFDKLISRIKETEHCSKQLKQKEIADFVS